MTIERKRVWNDETQEWDWDYSDLPKVPARPVNMRVRYRNGYVLYELLVGSGGGLPSVLNPSTRPVKSALDPLDVGEPFMNCGR